MSLEEDNASKDWSVNLAAAFVAWGIPMIIMVYARFLGDFSTAIAWPIALGWLSGTS